MVHTYEVLVDMKEYLEPLSTACSSKTTRYEINAESIQKADTTARGYARTDYPKASEYDIRVVRVLR